jgi:hypothetical protein
LVVAIVLPRFIVSLIDLDLSPKVGEPILAIRDPFPVWMNIVDIRFGDSSLLSNFSPSFSIVAFLD